MTEYPRTASRRQILSTLATTIATGSVLAACGPGTPAGSPDGGTQDAARKEPVTIQFAHWGTPDYYERNRARADDFEKSHPLIKIDILHLPDDFQGKMLAMFVAGTPPDTHVLDMPVVQAYARRDVLLSLNPFVKEDKTFKADLLQKKAVEIMSDPKGELLGMPSDGSPNLFYYNKDLFTGAGTPTPYELYQKNQWTWANLLEGVRKVTKGAPGAWQVAGVSTGLFRLWLNANGTEEFDSYRAPKKCLYADPAAVETFQFLTDLRHKYKVTPINFSKELGLDDTKAFIQGKVAMMARWTSGIGQFRDITDFTWGMVPYPKGPGAKGVMANDYATSGPAIARASKHPKESWEWVKYSANEEGQKVQATANRGTGVYFSDAANQETIRLLKEIKTLETPTMTVDLIKKGNSFVRLLSVDQSDINKLANDNLNPMFNGDDAPPVAAKRAADAINDFLKATPQ